MGGVMRRFGLALLLAIATLGTVHAQSVDAPWPTKPIRFIVPLPAGSIADLVARIVAAKLSDRLGQPIIIDNRPGASGSIGAEAVARAAPDGYTMGLATASTHAIAVSLNPNLAYDPVKDFAPVSMISDSPYVLVVTKELAAKNIAELIAMAKAKPGALRYSTDGPASLAQFAGALFATMAGVEITPVPYHTATHAVIDLMQGRIEMQFGLVGASLPFIQQGKLRALAVTSRRRVDVLPDVPTLSESGLPGYEAVLWMALVMPAGTPPAIVERVNRDTRALLAEPEVKKALAALVMQAASSTPEELRERIRRDIDKWRRLAAEAGIKAE